MTKCSLQRVNCWWDEDGENLEGGIRIFQKKPQKVRGRIVSSELRLLSNIYSTDRKNIYMFGK